jgi:tetratricopeptide (TPR) repeat protein
MKTHCLLLAAVLAAVSSATACADISFDQSDVPKPNGAADSSSSKITSQPVTSDSDARVSAVGVSTNSLPASDLTGVTSDNARVAALQQRFAHGQAVEAQGDLQQALAIFDGIIADAPDAKGSLREAGLISVELGDAVRADGYFSKLHALVPDYPMAIEALIQINQTLKRDAKVEILIAQYKRLYDAGKVPKPYFVRERIRLDGGKEIAITQFFDYHQDPHYAWAADLFDAQHNLVRRLTVNYDPDVTATMHKDPKLANAEQFLVVDNVMAGDHITRLDVYQQFLALPDYVKMRTVLVEIFAKALKPIDSAPVPQSAQ